MAPSAHRAGTLTTAAAELTARPGLHRWALGAVSMALDDLRARARGIPVSALYGPRLRDRVRPYASSRGYVEGSDAGRCLVRRGRGRARRRASGR